MAVVDRYGSVPTFCEDKHTPIPMVGVGLIISHRDYCWKIPGCELTGNTMRKESAQTAPFFFCICICTTPPGRTAVMMLPYYIASRNVIALTTTKKNVRLDYTSSRQPGVLCTQCLSQSGQPPSCRSKTVPAENYILSRELEATTVCSARSCCGLHFCSDAPSSTATRFSSPYWCCLRYLDRQN